MKLHTHMLSNPHALWWGCIFLFIADFMPLLAQNRSSSLASLVHGTHEWLIWLQILHLCRRSFPEGLSAYRYSVWMILQLPISRGPGVLGATAEYQPSLSLLWGQQKSKEWGTCLLEIYGDFSVFRLRPRDRKFPTVTNYRFVVLPVELLLLYPGWKPSRNLSHCLMRVFPCWPAVWTSNCDK